MAERVLQMIIFGLDLGAARFLVKDEVAAVCLQSAACVSDRFVLEQRTALSLRFLGQLLQKDFTETRSNPKQVGQLERNHSFPLHPRPTLKLGKTLLHTEGERRIW